MSSGSSTEAKASRTRRRFSPFPGVRARYVLATGSPSGSSTFRSRSRASFLHEMQMSRQANVTAARAPIQESAGSSLITYFAFFRRDIFEWLCLPRLLLARTPPSDLAPRAKSSKFPARTSQLRTTPLFFPRKFPRWLGFRRFEGNDC